MIRTGRAGAQVMGISRIGARVHMLALPAIVCSSHEFDDLLEYVLWEGYEPSQFPKE